jgi:hypothetical protein
MRSDRGCIAGWSMPKQYCTNSLITAQGTSGLMEFRWDNNDGYKKLYYYQTSAIQDDRSDWYLTLREKDRKTAILKLTVEGA